MYGPMAELNKKTNGLWHSWKNMFLQFFEGNGESYFIWLESVCLDGAVLYFYYFFHNVIML